MSRNLGLSKPLSTPFAQMPWASHGGFWSHSPRSVPQRGAKCSEQAVHWPSWGFPQAHGGQIYSLWEFFLTCKNQRIQVQCVDWFQVSYSVLRVSTRKKYARQCGPYPQHPHCLMMRIRWFLSQYIHNFISQDPFIVVSQDPFIIIDFNPINFPEILKLKTPMLLNQTWLTGNSPY